MHPKDDPRVTTDEREAIKDEVEDAVSKAMATPKPTSVSSTDMESAINKRCEKCRDRNGEIGKIWDVLDPIRGKVLMVTGALVVLGTVVGYTLPRINSKLDALDEMAKDMAALKVQVNFLIARPGAQLDKPSPSYATLPPGVTP
jgi:hypothetical protein